MAFYFPQAVMSLRIRWENHAIEGDPVLAKEYKLIVIAKRVTVSINDYNQADTFSAEIDFKNFPFDPRCIRAMGCSIHIEDRGKIFRSDNKLNIIEPTDENVVFLGFADEESIDFDTDNRVVRFEGRDYTSLLIDTPYDGKAIDMGRPIDKLIADLIGRLKTTEKITVDNRTGGDLPNLGKYAADFTPLGQSKSGKKKDNFWDVIKEIVRLAGLIAYIEIDKLVISKPRVLYGGTDNYNFIYGKNLRQLSFKRQLGRRKGINILVRSMNFEKKEVLEAKIPMEAKQSWATALSVPLEVQQIEHFDSNGTLKKEDAPYLSYNVPNITNKDHLIEIGQSIFEEVGRQQIEGKMVTKDMKNIQNEKTFDLVKLRNGSPLKIWIDQGDMEGIQNYKDEQDRERFLLSRNYPKDVAKAFARTMGKFSTAFYTKSVEYTVDKDSGFEMEIEFLNYIVTNQKGMS